MLNNSPIRVAKVRFLTSKPNEPTYNFKDVLESAFYGMLIHPLHTMVELFGKIIEVDAKNVWFNENKFSMQVILKFEDGISIIDWGNYSNRFECVFELINEDLETGVLKNLFDLEFSNLKNHKFDKNLLKGKETLNYHYSPLNGGFKRTGYQNEMEHWRDSIEANMVCPSNLQEALKVYEIIEMLKTKI